MECFSVVNFIVKGMFEPKTFNYLKIFGGVLFTCFKCCGLSRFLEIFPRDVNKFVVCFILRHTGSFLCTVKGQILVVKNFRGHLRRQN